MSQVDEEDEQVELAELARELDEEEIAWKRQLRKQMLMWLIRWTIGFAIIAIIYSYQPGWTWLWWSGIAIATVSLVFNVVLGMMMHRHFRRARQQFKEADAFAASIEGARQR
jgi:Flp pilus assembly protein TadB